MVNKFDDTTGFLFTGSQKSDGDEQPMAKSSSSSAFPKETASGGTDEIFAEVDETDPKMEKKKPVSSPKASKSAKQAKKDSKKVKKHHKK